MRKSRAALIRGILVTVNHGRERRRVAVVERLEAQFDAMAKRYAATAHLHPVSVADMSPAEKLALRLFLPAELQPAGLPSEEEIWAEAQGRRGDRDPG